MASIIRATKKPFLIMSLPEDIRIDILARVPRMDDPTVSLVSKHFQSLVKSPELFTRRSLLGCTEHCLYAILCKRLYILHPKASGARLVPIPSLPDMPSLGCFVAVGSKIYVFGGYYGDGMSLRALSIDCKSHTVQTLPDLPAFMANTCPGVIDGKIYITGYTDKKQVLVVFDTETQMWEPEMIEPAQLMVFTNNDFAVMADKLYISNIYRRTFVYVPKERKWTRDEMLNTMKWSENSCIVDDVLYHYDCGANKLTAYDPKQMRWGDVIGVSELFPDTGSAMWLGTVSYGGKLALLFSKEENQMTLRRDVWWAEIALERRNGGKICGIVENINEVVISDGSFIEHKFISVMV